MHPIETLCRNCRHACSMVQCGVPPDMLFLRLAGSNKIYSQSRTAHGGACCNLTTFFEHFSLAPSSISFLPTALLSFFYLVLSLIAAGGEMAQSGSKLLGRSDIPRASLRWQRRRGEVERSLPVWLGGGGGLLGVSSVHNASTRSLGLAPGGGGGPGSSVFFYFLFLDAKIL